MAHLSEDKNMIDAFLSNHDIHAATAAKIYKIDLKDVDSDMRRKAKTANFGIIYGISVFGLAERMNVDRKEAKELIDGYFETYPSVKAYMEKSIQIAQEKGYVEKERVEEIVIEEMEHAYRMHVPLKADCGWGKNWLEAH